MKILLAIDGSPCSDAAVAEVARRQWPPGSEVRIVKVDAPIEPDLLRSDVNDVFAEVARQRLAETALQLRKAAEVIEQSSPGLRVTQALLSGWPKDAIVAEAERWGADLVVVGSHGYGPIRRFFLGSVSLYVAHNAPCSVLIVRPPRENPPATDAPT